MNKIFIFAQYLEAQLLIFTENLGKMSNFKRLIYA